MGAVLVVIHGTELLMMRQLDRIEAKLDEVLAALKSAGTTAPTIQATPCFHKLIVDGKCGACGQCYHTRITNGKCDICGDISYTVP